MKNESEMGLMGLLIVLLWNECDSFFLFFFPVWVTFQIQALISLKIDRVMSVSGWSLSKTSVFHAEYVRFIASVLHGHRVD